MNEKNLPVWRCQHDLKYFKLVNLSILSASYPSSLTLSPSLPLSLSLLSLPSLPPSLSLSPLPPLSPPSLPPYLCRVPKELCGLSYGACNEPLEEEGRGGKRREEEGRGGKRREEEGGGREEEGGGRREGGGRERGGKREGVWRGDYYHLTRASSTELVKACPKWRGPVTLGGGSTITNFLLSSTFKVTTSRYAKKRGGGGGRDERTYQDDSHTLVWRSPAAPTKHTMLPPLPGGCTPLPSRLSCLHHLY